MERSEREREGDIYHQPQGEITTAGTLDRETIDVYTITVLARDSADIPKTGYASVSAYSLYIIYSEAYSSYRLFIYIESIFPSKYQSSIELEKLGNEATISLLVTSLLIL